MHRLYILFFSYVLFISSHAVAQQQQGPLSPDRILINYSMYPFYHGVASGDPLTDRVILWTRVTPDTVVGTVAVKWEMALDTFFTTVVASGNTSTSATKDFTVKVDASGLQANTYYYYRFEALGIKSMMGRTKTLPAGGVDTLRFAVVSCQNFDAGYYNAYKEIGKRNDIDAVIHLGDYIYEGGGTAFTPDRNHSPGHEILSLMDYRMRHSQYRLDPDLRYAHQQYPFICVWDDHEIANDAWRDGAENHDPQTEGNWNDRKYAATRTYMEWMPIRLPDLSDSMRIFRSFDYGNLVKLVMLDTRHYDRDQQSSSTNNDSSRTMLGSLQYQWLKDELSQSSQSWTLLGQQVMFAPLKVFNIPVNQDQWDGYPAERKRVQDHIMNNNIENVVVLTGDIHTSWGNDVPYNSSYDPQTGANSVCVEYVTTSITSANSPLPVSQAIIQAANNHVKFVDLDKHGYVLLDVNSQRTQGDWYFVNTVTDTAYAQNWEQGWFCNAGERFLRKANAPAPPSSIVKQPQAPLVTGTEIAASSNHPYRDELTIFAAFPNPFTDNVVLEYHVQKSREIAILLSDLEGRTVRTLNLGRRDKGLYVIKIETADLPAGNYILSMQSDGVVTSKQLLKVGR